MTLADRLAQAKKTKQPVEAAAGGASPGPTKARARHVG